MSFMQRKIDKNFVKKENDAQECQELGNKIVFVFDKFFYVLF